MSALPPSTSNEVRSSEIKGLISCESSTDCDTPIDSLERRCAELIKGEISIRAALGANFVTTHSLLRCLVSNKPTRFSIIAYYGICQVYGTDDQYIDGRHFLSLRPDLEYTLIYILAGGDTSVPVIKDKLKDETITQYLVITVSEIATQGSRFKEMQILFGKGRARSESLSDCVLSFTGHNSTGFPLCHFSRWSKEAQLALINSDWFEGLEQVGRRLPVNRLGKRIHKIYNETPLYWQHVAKPGYSDLLKSINFFDRINILTMIKLAPCFPGKIDDRVVNLGRDAITLCQESAVTLGYLLGFSLHVHLPSRNQTIDALVSLDSKGVDRYYADLKDKTQAYLQERSFFSPIPTSSGNDPNYQDTLTEDIASYSIFDIIAVRSDKVEHYYTRPEFKKLIETRQDFYDRSYIPPFILAEIKNRSIWAKEVELPNSGPLIDIAKKFIRSSENASTSPRCSTASAPYDLSSGPPVLPLIPSVSLIPSTLSPNQRSWTQEELNMDFIAQMDRIRQNNHESDEDGLEIIHPESEHIFDYAPNMTISNQMGTLSGSPAIMSIIRDIIARQSESGANNDEPTPIGEDE